jgi:2'-5' RNA ligase
MHPKLLALDVAILPPPEVRERAIALSAAIVSGHEDRLRLDAEHMPHVTLTQQFIREEELDAAFERIDEVLRGQPPLQLRVSGAGKGGHSVWMAIERDDAIAGLHERMMEALRGFERTGGTAAAFHDGDARVGDVVWVAGYRLKSSFGAFTPHITLGPGDTPPHVEPFTFEAVTVAACHLGRFCSCRRALRVWTLT